MSLSGNMRWKKYGKVKNSYRNVKDSFKKEIWKNDEFD